LIKIENLWYRYGSGERWALKNINLFLKPGEIGLIVGPNGSGKTTLAKAIAGILPEFYSGELCGKVIVNTVNVLDKPEEAFRYVGYVGEDPEVQLVTLTVKDEVMFGPSNLGLPLKEIVERANWALRVSGAENLKDRTIFELSGGEMQKVALASILALKPKVLILDEPTAFIEAPLAKKFYEKLRDIAKKESITIMLIEHKLNHVINIADKIFVLKNGEIVFQKNVKELTFSDIMNNPMPKPIETLFGKIASKEGYEAKPLSRVVLSENTSNIVEIESLWYKYPRSKNYALKNVNLKIPREAKVGLLGPNGSGKSTLIKIIAGIIKPQRGVIRIYGEFLKAKIGYVPQNPTLSFTQPTPYKEVYETAKKLKLANPEYEAWKSLKMLGLEEYAEKPVLHLSYGFRRRLSIASALVGKPRLLLLDEPTAYLDFDGKVELIEVLNTIAKEYKTTLIIASHDTWFISEICDLAAILHRGSIRFVGEIDSILKLPEIESYGIENPFHGGVSVIDFMDTR